MPRYIEMFLKFLSHWATVTVGIVLIAVLMFIYNRPQALATATPPENFETPGVRPSEDAGVLGGYKAQREAMQALTRELKSVQGKLSQLEEQPQVRGTDPKVTAALQQQLKVLQAQVAQGQRAKKTTPSETKPEVSLRVIGEAPDDDEGASPYGSKKRSKGIQIVQPTASAADSDPQAAPYLPPQAYGRGRVKDGYTGLASLETFRVTLEATSAFSASNGKTVPITGCRFGAIATPEEITARGRLNLTKITCINDHGKTIERDIEGYITAADNINGQIAQIFWHEREVLSAFGKAGIPAALIALFRETRRVVDVATLTGVVVSSGNTVAQEAARRMMDIYLDKAEKLASPVVWVGPDTPVFIYITEGARLDGLLTVQAEPEPLAERMRR